MIYRQICSRYFEGGMIMKWMIFFGIMALASYGLGFYLDWKAVMLGIYGCIMAMACFVIFKDMWKYK